VTGRDRGPPRSRQDQYQGGNVVDVVAELYRAHRKQARKKGEDLRNHNRMIALQREWMDVPMEDVSGHDEF